MTSSRILLTLAAIAATAGVAAAQPSDKQIKKDLTSKGTKSVKLLGKGTVQLNADTLNYEYVRGAEIVGDSEYKGVKVVIRGDAVYQRSGKSKYTYWKFRVIDNQYLGIPNPSATDIDAILDTDPVARYGEGFVGNIVKVIEPMKLAAEPAWFWHTPMSVSFQMVAKVDMVASYTELETELVTFDVRLYRDELDDPWQRFMVSPAKREKLGRTKYTADEIKNMPKLRQQVAEVAAKKAAAERPAVTVPAFATVEELARFIHKTLREEPLEKVEAILRAVIAPRHYASGSTVLLASSGDEIVNGALEAIGPYATQYCANATFDARGSKNRFAIIGVKDSIVSEVVAVKAGGKLVDGVEVGASWKLDGLVARTKDDEKTRAWIASFSDRKKLCPND